MILAAIKSVCTMPGMDPGIGPILPSHEESDIVEVVLVSLHSRNVAENTASSKPKETTVNRNSDK